MLCFCRFYYSSVRASQRDGNDYMHFHTGSSVMTFWTEIIEFWGDGSYPWERVLVCVPGTVRAGFLLPRVGAAGICWSPAPTAVGNTGQEIPGTGRGATVSHSGEQEPSFPHPPFYSVVFLYEWQMKAVLVLTQMIHTYSRTLCPAFLLIKCSSIGV